MSVDVPENLPVAWVLANYSDGDERGWDVEFAWLRANHTARLADLTASILDHGVQVPILLGPDGRIWDGHHRLCVARHLGLRTIPCVRAVIAHPHRVGCGSA